MNELGQNVCTHSLIPSEGFATHELLLDCATFFDVGRGGLLELRDHDAFVLDFGSVRRGSDVALFWPRRFLLLLVLVLRVDVLVLVVRLLRVAVLLFASFEILETAHLVVVVFAVLVISRRQVFLVLLLVAIVALPAKDGRPAPLFAVVLGIEDGFSLFPELAGPVFGAAQQSAARLQEAREERGRKARTLRRHSLGEPSCRLDRGISRRRRLRTPLRDRSLEVRNISTLSLP